jgi:uncharacterized membrane protein
MPDPQEITAADLDAFVKIHDLVPVPEDLVPRVLQALHEHRAAMHRFAAAGLETRDVFPANIFRA